MRIGKGVHPGIDEDWPPDSDVNIQIYPLADLEWVQLGEPRMVVEALIFDCHIHTVDSIGWDRGEYHGKKIPTDHRVTSRWLRDVLKGTP